MWAHCSTLYYLPFFKEVNWLNRFALYEEKVGTLQKSLVHSKYASITSPTKYVFRIFENFTSQRASKLPEVRFKSKKKDLIYQIDLESQNFQVFLIPLQINLCIILIFKALECDQNTSGGQQNVRNYSFFHLLSNYPHFTP